MDDAERLAVGAALLVRVVQPAAAAATIVDDVLERHAAPRARRTRVSTRRRSSPWTYSIAKKC